MAMVFVLAKAGKATFARRSLENKTYSRYIIPEEIHVHKDGFLIGSLPDKGANVLRKERQLLLKERDRG